MPLIWIKKGEDPAHRTFYNREGFCCLRHLKLEPFSIKLDSIAGLMEEGCIFSVSRLREETNVESGSTALLAVVVTGTTGIHALLTTIGMT